MVPFAKPASSFIAHFFIAIGLALRLWAAGYIGAEARGHAFHATQRIRSGPYRLLKHPLYAGNFFLVLGVILIYNPSQWLGIAYVALFLLIYSAISSGEMDHLRGKPEIKVTYQIRNLRGEISTLIVMAVIYVIWYYLLAGT